MRYLAGFLLTISLTSCSCFKEEWESRGSTRYEVAKQFDNYISKQKVVEIWSLYDKRNISGGGCKDGGYNFLEVWICEPNVYYTFALYTFGLMDFHSLPSTGKGEWRRSDSGEIELKIPVKEWRELDKRTRVLRSTDKFKYVKPEKYHWELSEVYKEWSPSEKDHYYKISLLKKIPEQSASGNGVTAAPEP